MRWLPSLRQEPLALTAVILAAVLVAYGIWWGWGESWNPDEMAFRYIFNGGRLLEPSDYKKPPFHTYTNFLLSVGPFNALQLAGKAITGQKWNITPAMLTWSRILQLLMFVGIVYATLRISARFAGDRAAAIVALLTATSAGIVLQAHFLTADVPVLLWMLVAFYVSQSILFDGRMRTYLFAGLWVGVATATKYNGLAVGLAIPIFHFYANRERPWRSILFDRRLFAGVALVIVGFVLANPYSVLDFQRFAADFAYNYAVTPVYNGANASHYGFGVFLHYIPDIIGWPATAACALACVFAITRLRSASREERASVAAALGVFLLYFLEFGRPPRIETRFVLPVVSFLLIASAPFWAVALSRYRVFGATAAVALLAYNILASYYVGKRFSEDPRMLVQAWLRANVPAHETVESSTYTPRWNRHAGIDIDDVRMPTVSGRKRVLSRVFAANESMLEDISSREQEANLNWYAPGALTQRRPAFVAVDSMFYDRFLNLRGAGGDYPEINRFVNDLLANKLGYHVVFDRTTQASPAWLYPRDMDFVDNRMVVLARDAGPPIS